MENITERIEIINQKHQLDLKEEDVHIFDGTLYISSQKAAALLHTSYQAFSCNYTKPLEGKVARIKLGKSCWYSLSDLEQVIQKSIAENKSVFEICKS